MSKNKTILLLCLGLIILTSCKAQEEKEEGGMKSKVKVTIAVPNQREMSRLEEERLKKERLKKEEEAHQEREVIEARSNPLREYITDEAYDEGKSIFYRKKQYMFTVDKKEFAINFETLSQELKEKFKITMLMTHKEKSLAMLNYKDDEGIKRIIVNKSKTINIEGIDYYIVVFKDRVEVKKGENSLAIPIYSRER